MILRYAFLTSGLIHIGLIFALSAWLIRPLPGSSGAISIDLVEVPALVPIPQPAPSAVMPPQPGMAPKPIRPPISPSAPRQRKEAPPPSPGTEAPLPARESVNTVSVRKEARAAGGVLDRRPETPPPTESPLPEPPIPAPRAGGLEKTEAASDPRPSQAPPATDAKTAGSGLQETASSGGIHAEEGPPFLVGPEEIALAPGKGSEGRKGSGGQASSAGAEGPRTGSGTGNGVGTGQEEGRTGTGEEGSGKGSAAFSRSVGGQKDPMDHFLERVRRRIEASKRYPYWARRQRQEGESHIEFTMLSNGRVAAVKIVQSSGHEVLDRAAIETVEQAAPFPSIPKEVRSDSLQLKVPIVFKLNGRY